MPFVRFREFFSMRFRGLFIVIIVAAVNPVGAQQSDFVPVTDAVLRNPDPRRLVELASRSQRQRIQPIAAGESPECWEVGLGVGVADGGWASGAGTDRLQGSDVPSPFQ